MDGESGVEHRDRLGRRGRSGRPQRACPCGSGRKYKRCHGDPRTSGRLESVQDAIAWRLSPAGFRPPRPRCISSGPSGLGCPGAAGCGNSRSSRRASARTRGPTPTTTDTSITPAVGRDVTTRRTTGCCPPASIGPSLRMRLRARSVVQGTSWPGGRDPASVSASTWANRLGQTAAGGSFYPLRPVARPARSGTPAPAFTAAVPPRRPRPARAHPHDLPVQRAAIAAAIVAASRPSAPARSPSSGIPSSGAARCMPGRDGRRSGSGSRTGGPREARPGPGNQSASVAVRPPQIGTRAARPYALPD